MKKPARRKPGGLFRCVDDHSLRVRELLPVPLAVVLLVVPVPPAVLAPIDEVLLPA
jgi:hypothetical protein